MLDCLKGQDLQAYTGRRQVSSSKLVLALGFFNLPAALWPLGLRLANLGERQLQQDFDAFDKQAQDIVGSLCAMLSDSTWSAKKVVSFAYSRPAASQLTKGDEYGKSARFGLKVAFDRKHGAASWDTMHLGEIFTADSLDGVQDPQWMPHELATAIILYGKAAFLSISFTGYRGWMLVKLWLPEAP